MKIDWSGIAYTGKLMAISSLFLMAFLAILWANGCTQYQADVPETTEQYYLKARMTFNGLLADYVDQKRMAPAETRAEWTAKIDPWFERGAVALKAWGVALKAGQDSQALQQEYLELKSQLLQILLQELTRED